MAWLEIDLDRLGANLAAVRRALPPGVRLEPVVKADAYGHGAVPVASWLERSGADGLCVATLDEGLALRRAGVRLPILVLYPIPPDGAPVAAQAGLALAIGDRTLLERTIAALATGAHPDTGRPGWVVPLHVEIETGLGRGGVAVADLAATIATIDASPFVELAGIWSHLAAPEAAERSAGQAAAFAAALETIGATDAAPVVILEAEVDADSDAIATGRTARIRPIRHLAATGGFLAVSAPDYDSVRLGLGLYGLLPDRLPPDAATAAVVTALRPVMSLHARPVRVADLPAGHGIGYGPSHVTTRPSRIATLPIGYGDGWPRSLSNWAEALVRGRRVPLVGTVAMDAVMADVTDIAGEPVTVDDEFVLLGAQEGVLGSDEIPAWELAQRRTTIAWEVVTQMARRMPRVYHAAAVPVGVRTLTEEVYLWSLE